MLAMKPANHEPESLANVLIVCRFCGRNAKWSDLVRSDLSVYFIEASGFPARDVARRHGVTACLSSAVQRYPSCGRVANITIGTIVCDNVASCALESAAKQAAPRTMIGGGTKNLNRIPSIDPISVLQIA